MHENDPARFFVAGQLFAAESNDFVSCGSVALFWDNHRDYLFSHLGVGYPDHRYLGDCRVCRQHVLDLAWVDIVATTDNQFASATGDCVISIVTVPAEI